MPRPGDDLGSVGAIIVAAGQSRRFGADKLYCLLAGRPLLAHSLQVFRQAPTIRQVVLVVAGERLAEAERLVAATPGDAPVRLTTGGARRQDSVQRGLAQVDGCEWVAIHDGARPLVTPDIIARGVAAVRETGAAVAAVPVKDTIKRVGAGGIVAETPPRDSLWAAQTPQLFRTALLRQAFASAAEDVTDEATLVERLGLAVRVFPSDYENIKVTTAEDLLIAEALLAARRRSAR